MQQYDVTLQEAEAHIEQGNLREGRSMLNNLRLKFPESIAVVNDLAVVEMLEGNFDTAQGLLKGILVREPDNEIAHENLEIIAARRTAAPGTEAPPFVVPPVPLPPAERGPAGSGAAFMTEKLFGDYTSRTIAWKSLGPEHVLQQLTCGDHPQRITITAGPEPSGRTSDGFPIPPSTLTMGYGGGNMDTYMATGRWSFDALSALMTAHNLKIEPGDAVLDWGCASGRVLQYFRDVARTCEVWGGDVDWPSIEWARSNLSPPLKFFNCSSLPYLPFPDATFKFIYALSVFTHLTLFRDMWLLELSRVLRKDGLLIVTVHDENTWKHFKENGMPGWVPQELAMKPLLPGECVELRGSYWYDNFTFFTTAYLRRVWGQYFEVLEIRPKSEGYQSAVVLRKHT